jgi:hypothetical protein
VHGAAGLDAKRKKRNNKTAARATGPKKTAPKAITTAKKAPTKASTKVSTKAKICEKGFGGLCTKKVKEETRGSQ